MKPTKKHTQKSKYTRTQNRVNAGTKYRQKPSLESVLTSRNRLADTLVNGASTRQEKRRIRRMFDKGNNKIIAAYEWGMVPPVGLHHVTVKEPEN